MGIGTLIIFIAMLLVAAIAAGVLIQTTGTLQEKSLTTGQQAKTQISTNIRTVEVSATNGTSRSLTDFRHIIKLAPGSDPIKLDYTLLTFNTKSSTSTLKYRGTSGLCLKGNNGYNTWNEEINANSVENYRGRDTSENIINLINTAPRDTFVDLDDDGSVDYVWICGVGNPNCPAPYNISNNYMVFSLSTDGVIYVPIFNDDESPVNLKVVGVAGAMNITELNISTYGFINAFRTDADTSYLISNNDPAGSYFRIFENRNPLAEDYDDDGLDDYYAVNDTHIIIFTGNGVEYPISLGANISAGPVAINVNEDFSNSTTTFGNVLINANTIIADYIPASSITITPYRIDEGYFTAIYENDGTNHVDGNIQRGDIVRLCYESPESIEEDSLVRISILPKIGTTTLTEFITPDVISTERVYLYP
jgi:archaellin